MSSSAGVGLDQSTVEAGREVGRWRTEMLERLLRWVFALGSAVALPSVLFALRAGEPVVAVADVLALGVLAVVTFRRRISFRVRAGGFVVLVYGLGVVLLWAVGLVAQLYLLAVPVLTVVLFGRRAAVVALVVCPATLLIAALVFDRDLAAPAVRSSDLVGWSVITVNFVFVCWILTYAAGRLIARLEGSLARQRRIASDASRLALAVEQASDAILVAEPDGRVAYANAAHAELAERLGRDHGVKRLDELRDRDGGPVRLPDRDDPSVWSGTVVLYDVRSDEHRFVARIWPLGDGDGAVTGIVALLRDVTEETRREARRRRSERLEALGTLASGTAHDFNNVTTTILLVAEQLRARSDDPSVRADMDLIASACQRAGDVVRNMLLFGRQGDVVRSPIPLGSTITDGLHLVRAGLPPDVELVPHLVDGTGHVSAHPSELQQILMNLASNAVKAMADVHGVARGRLEVRVDREVVGDGSPTDDRILTDEHVSVLTVSDTGHGIEPDDLDRVFDPFFTTKASGEGSGLGLASVHGIVSSLGGAVAVRSRPGRGTTFRIELPECAPTSTPAPASADDGAEAAGAPPQPARGARRVLLVEDDPAIRALSSAWLARQGHDVVTAVDGADAVAVFDADPERVDVLVTDVAMPRLDGPALVRHVRARRPELPVVVTSGYGEAEVDEVLGVAGDDVAVVRLPKPYSLDELLAVVAPLAGS